MRFWYLVVRRRRGTAAGVVALYDNGTDDLPLAVMTKQRTGRHGQPPKWEIPSGHNDPLNPEEPQGRRESLERTQRREVLEEVGAELLRITPFALRFYKNPEGSLYGRNTFMVFGVSFVKHFVAPLDREHERAVMPLYDVGELARAGQVVVGDAKLVQAGAIAAGHSRKEVMAAMGSLPE